MRRWITLLLLAACSKGISIPADRKILDWTGATATDANKLLLPKGFTAPSETACAQDTTRQYMGELFVHGITQTQVNWHWAPVVPGPKALPTLDQPEFSLAGTIDETDDSGDDVLADHPFGLDVDADVEPDPAYGFLTFEARRSTVLHTELEARTFPRTALGLAPQSGDRTLMRGVWVLDCGHPPYGSEIHPPTFYSYAHAQDAKTTLGAAFVAPYRSSLLFSSDVSLATALSNTARFGLSGTQPFEQAMITGVEQAVLTNAPNLTTHALMVPTKFDSLDFLVCAPLPRPAGAQLQASWRFTARTGVNVGVQEYGDAGCVRVSAAMTADYKPAPITYASAEWPWQELSDSASSQLGQSIDVRQAIIDALNGNGIDASGAPALQADHPPLIDAYAAPQPRAGADQDSPSAIDAKADDQPFPLYGRVRVSWR